MRVLGVDIGLKRTGLAISDETGIAIKLLPNLLAHSRAKALEKIMALIKEMSIEAVVIGCPKPATPGSKAIASRALGLKVALDEALLNANFLTKTFIWDESLTSKRASAQLIEAGIPKKKRALMLDAASAAILVEEFLHAHKER